MWRKFQNNPCGKSIGDCAVRAISVALGLSWYGAYDLLCEKGRDMCNLPSADEVWGAVLLDCGFKRYAVTRQETALDFTYRHPDGVFVLAFGGHVATVINGELFDSWDSSDEIPIYFYGRS